MENEKFDILKEYKKLRNKFGDLPEFEYLNNNFELENIDKNDFLLRKIRRKVCEKIVSFSRILESILNPNSQSYMTNYESTAFDDEDQKNLLIIHGKLMIIERNSLSLDVSGSLEDEDKEFIIQVLKQFENFKTEIIKVVNKMADSWTKEIEEDREKYFG